MLHKEEFIRDFEDMQGFYFDDCGLPLQFKSKSEKFLHIEQSYTEYVMTCIAKEFETMTKEDYDKLLGFCDNSNDPTTGRTEEDGQKSHKSSGDVL